MLKKIAVVSIALSLFAAGAFLSNAKADNNNKITICHATGSNSNPYVTNQPDKSGDVDGHDGHNGPIWFSGITTMWGDIIPPFDYQTTVIVGTHLECTGGGYVLDGNVCTKDKKPDQQPNVVNDYGTVTAHYAGKNYDAQGQAILANNCNYVAPVIPTPTTPVVDPCVANPASCVAPTATPTATVAQSSTGGSNSGGPGDGLGCATHDCSGNQVGGPSTSNTQAVLGASTGPTQDVLGASTFAGTGTFANTIMNFLFVAGMIVLSLGGLSYAKEKSK